MPLGFFPLLLADHFKNHHKKVLLEILLVCLSGHVPFLGNCHSFQKFPAQLVALVVILVRGGANSNVVMGLYWHINR